MVLLLLYLAATPAVGDGADEELLIKAGFVTKFPSYITWPAGVAQSPFSFCVAAASPLLPYLEALVPLAIINGREPLLRTLTDLGAAAECQLLVLPPLEPAGVRDILSQFGDLPILLVGAAPGLASAGVHINLYRAEDRVRFAINRAAFKRSGLRVGFRLLEMARLVE